MSGPRVFLISVNQLVCEAVNALLRREGIELLGMETDPDLALAQICRLDPDVVLVEGNGTGKDARLMTNLAQLVYERKDLHVIRLCLNDGQLQIYHQQQRRLVDTKDLVSAILQPDESSNGNHA